MAETRSFDDAADRTRDHTQPAASAPPPAVASAPPGYRIVGELGRGGMGVVYDAVQTTLNRPCALKMVLGSGHAGSVALIRFLAEAEAVAAIDHPHVVRVFEFGNHDGHPFLAMERLDGGSLADRLKETGPLPVADAVTLLERVAAGVQAGHDLGIVHRDLKPANILLSSDGTPKVTDFGLAKRDSGGDLTATNAMMGTPEYMSPEQAKGQTKFVGPTADVYSLGAILYATLSGRPPFQCPSVYDLRLKVISEEAPSLTKVAPSVPRDLAIIAAKCLAKDPAERYPTAAAFADDLRRWRTGDTIVARAASNQERVWKAMQRNRGLVAAVGTVVVALCVGLVGTSVAALLAMRALAEAERADKETMNAVERANGERAKALEAAGLAERERVKAVAAAVQADEEKAKAVEAVARADGEADKAQGSERRAIAQKERADGESSKAVQAALEANVEKSKAQAESLRAEKQLDRAERFSYASQVNQADRHYRTGAVANAIDCLDRTRWDFRGWEHDHLTTQFHAGHVTLAMNRDRVSEVTGIGFSPDGKQVVSCSVNCTLRQWDAASGLELGTVEGHRGGVAISLDSSQVASGEADGTVKLWDAASGRPQCTLAGHAGGVSCVAFSPDGKQVVSAGTDDAVRFRDAATGKLVPTRVEPRKGRYRAALDPEGSQLISGSIGRSLKLWDAVSGRELRTLAEHTGEVSSVAISPDGRRVASGASDGDVKLWDAATGREQLILVGHKGAVGCVAISPDGRRVASGGFDQTVKLWDAATGREQLTLSGHRGAVGCVAISPDGRRVASGASDGAVKLWEAASGRELRTLAGHPGEVSSVAFSPDGGCVASGGGGDDGTVRLWDAASGRELLTFAGHAGSVSSVAISPDGRRVATGGGDGSVKLWDAASGREQLTLAGHTNWVYGVAISSDGTRVASGGFDKTVKLWNAVTGRQQLTLTGHTDVVSSVAFSPDGTRLASGGIDGLKIFDTATGQELGSSYIPSDTASNIKSVVFEPTGRGIMYICKLSVVSLRNTLQSCNYNITSATGSQSIAFAVSELGQKIVNQSSRDELTVYSLTTGQRIEDEPISPNLTFVTRADLPDGKREVFIEGGKIVVRDKAKYAAFQAEMARRLVEYAKPKPEWHARSFDEALAAKDLFAARFHLGYLRKIKGNSDLRVRWRETLLPKDALPKPVG